MRWGLLPLILDHFEFEVERFAANDETQVGLPEAANEAQRRKAIGAIDEKFETEQAPESEQCDANHARPQRDVAVEGELRFLLLRKV